MAEQAVIRFESTRTLRRGPHARKVLVFLAGRMLSIDVSNEDSANNVRKLAAMAQPQRGVRRG